MHKKAFTLIELLVVIAIIALLLSVLIPALRAAKLQAQATVCLSNINGVSKAWLMYAQDDHDELVGNYTRWIASPDFSWVECPQDINGNSVSDSVKTTEDEIRGIEKGLLFSYLNNPKCYHCPADKRFLDQNDSGGMQGWRTYSIASGVGQCSQYEIDKYLYYYPHVKLSTIKSPGTKYIIVEEGEKKRGYNVNSYVFKAVAPSPVLTDPLGFFHGDRSMIGFADGHGENHKWWDKTQIDRSKSGEANDYPVSATSPDYIWLRQNFTYLKAK